MHQPALLQLTGEEGHRQQGHPRALGGGVGAAAGYDNERDSRRVREGARYEERSYYYEDGRRRYRDSDFCPPGQAKKGRC